MTVTRFENGHSGGAPETLAAIERALETAGIAFIPENGGGAGVRLARPRVAAEGKRPEELNAANDD